MSEGSKYRNRPLSVATHVEDVILLYAMFDKQWESNSDRIDWHGFEHTMANILDPHARIADSDRVDLAREALDAFTKRGYFMI